MARRNDKVLRCGSRGLRKERHLTSRFERRRSLVTRASGFDPVRSVANDCYWISYPRTSGGSRRGSWICRLLILAFTAATSSKSANLLRTRVVTLTSGFDKSRT